MQDMRLRSAVERVLAGNGVRGPFDWRALGQGVGGARWRLSAEGGDWFVKLGEADVLAAEADGLAALGSGLRVPSLLASAAEGGEGFLLLEWLPLAPASRDAAAALGEALARLHLVRGARFGWPRPNFIGATPQFNTEGNNWPRFFRDQRLGFQLRLAGESGHRGELQEQGARLMQGLPQFFSAHAPHPALLHGDLWGGNWAALAGGGFAVFDPAVYRGDREADLAMTELFGGFPPEFYAAYRMHAPLDAGYPVRRDLYNLYHVLNHLNLFGEAYLGQALSLIRRLLAELR
jgi:fructosamine-3-kinase